MATRSPCGDLQGLKALLEDRLPPAEQVALTAHLETCESCRRAFDDLAAGSRWWSDLRQSVRPGLPPDTSVPPTLAMDQVRRGLPGEVTAEEGPADGGPPLDFLGPPETPGHLGRFGPYEVLELIGRGGMGVVLKAFDPALHRFVAIKVLAPQLATGVAARRRFVREARAAASVVHEHVVTIHAVDEQAGLPYLVMQYVNCKSLQERIDQTGPLELKVILRIGMQTAQGLAAAHAQGLIHRDIKPANILLENGVERVKITDFGLARAADDASLTQSGVVAGTPQYMAPEQARGEPLDHRADLFSLGSVLYAMATGRSPFRAETTVAVLRRVCEDTPRPIREVNPDAPDWLAAIVAKLLAKDPAQRFQTAAEVAELLGRHLAHLQGPSQAPPPRIDVGESSSVKEAPRRRTVAPRVVAAAVLVLACGLGWSEVTGVTHVAASLATVLRISTPDGTLIIEVNDPAVRIDIDGTAVAIRGMGIQEVRLHPGPHLLRATKDNVPVLTQLVRISRGEKQVVRVSLEGRPAAPDAGPGARPEAVPAGATHRFIGHEGPVRAVAFSPDGRRALSGSGYPYGDSTVRLWDVETGAQLGTFRDSGITMAVHDKEPRPSPAYVGTFLDAGMTWVLGVAFSPDGRLALSSSFDGIVRLWDLNSGGVVHRFKGHTAEVDHAVFSPDGRRALSGAADKTVRLWDVETGRELRRFEGHTDKVTDVAFSPDGRRALSSGSDGTVRLWDVDGGQELLRFEGHTATVNGVAFSPDGRRALSCGDDQTLRLWDVEDGRELRRFTGHTGRVLRAVFSPDGRRALSGSHDKTVRQWDVDSGAELRRFEGHADWVWSVAISPDGRFGLSGGGGEIKHGLWSAGNDFALRLWALPEPGGDRRVEGGEIRR